MANEHKALAQSVKADKIVAEFHKYKLPVAKVGLMTDVEWDEVAKFLGFAPSRETGKYISPETKELVLTRLRGGNHATK